MAEAEPRGDRGLPLELRLILHNRPLAFPATPRQTSSRPADAGRG
uniref:Uncharacterized protein n=1 Tax=Arundo donax TaxID=35708 RepID=A0A0A9F5T2_ARUDO